MRIMLLLLALIVLVSGCGSLGSGGRPVSENTGPIESLGAKLKEDIKLNQMGRVIEINLTDKAVTDEDLKVIAQYKHLQMLKLARTGVTDAGLSNLRPLQNLRAIWLARTGVSDAGLAHLAELKSLREVRLYPNRVTDSAVDELKAKLPGIRVIY